MIRHPIVLAILIGITSLGVFVPGQIAAQDATGAISGVIVYDGRPEIQYEFGIMVVPADLPQPLSFLNDGPRYFIRHDRSGSFSVSGLPAGEYLVGFNGVQPDFAPSLTESILVLDDREHPLGLPQTTYRYPATRVRVQNGQTTDLEIRILLPVFPTVEPVTTVPGLARGAGRISGRIYLGSCDSCQGSYSLMVIPADLGRALDLGTLGDYEKYRIDTDDSGRGFYTVTDIADGDYLVAPLTDREFATSFSEKVTYTLGTDRTDLPARRVRIANGEAVTGVDFLFKELPVLGSASELPAPQEDGISGLPATQEDGISLADVASYIGVAVAALAVLALVRGVALRVRGSRSR